MHDLIFSPPWWLSAIVLIVGATVFYVGNAGQKSKVRLAGVAVILLAVLMMALGYFVETDKEKVSRLTRELVQSVPARDWVKMTGLLDPDASLNPGPYTDRSKLVEGAKANAEGWGVKTVSILSLNAKADPNGMFVVDIDTLADANTMVGSSNVPTSWRIYWDKNGTDWHVHLIECTKVMNDTSASTLRGFIK